MLRDKSELDTGSNHVRRVPRFCHHPGAALARGGDGRSGGVVGRGANGAGGLADVQVPLGRLLKSAADGGGGASADAPVRDGQRRRQEEAGLLRGEEAAGQAGFQLDSW